MKTDPIAERARDVLDKHTAWNGHPTVQEAVDAMVAFAALTTESRPEGLEQWQHVKRGTVYRVIGRGELQMNNDCLVDGSAMVIYQGDDGRFWVREEGEFEDGRFVRLATPHPQTNLQENLAGSQTAAPASGEVERCANCDGEGESIKSDDKLHPYRVVCKTCGNGTANHGDFKASWQAWRRRPTPSEGARDSALEEADAARYLIRKGGAYYRPNAQGYTRNKAEAGRYTLVEAIFYSHPNGPHGPRDDIDYALEDAVRTAKPEQAGAGHTDGELS